MTPRTRRLIVLVALFGLVAAALIAPMLQR